MMRVSLVAAFILAAGATAANARAPLYDPVTLNIGLSCQWQERCISKQKRAMKRSLKFVRKYQPPAWKVQLCNRNASRRRNRVDWVGYENCIRNAALRPPPTPPAAKKRARPISQRRTAPRGFGERG